MRYVFSGLVGFFLTLVLSIPLQQLVHLREVQAVTMKAKNAGLGSLSQSGPLEMKVDVPPLAEVSKDAREPRLKFLPQYPQEAITKQLTGYVTLTYQVNKDGTVRDLKVIKSQPPQVFDQAARRAVSRWIYPTQVQTGKGESLEQQRLTLVFNLKRSLASE